MCSRSRSHLLSIGGNFRSCLFVFGYGGVSTVKRWVLQWVFRLLRAWARRNRDAIHRYFTERVLFISEENLRALSGGDDSVYRGLRVGYTIARLRVRLLIDDFIEGRVLPDTIVRR